MIKDALQERVRKSIQLSRKFHRSGGDELWSLLRHRELAENYFSDSSLRAACKSESRMSLPTYTHQIISCLVLPFQDSTDPEAVFTGTQV